MAIIELPPLKELPRIAHETLAWTGRHWKSLSLAAAAALGGGYLLFAPDSNPPNPSLRPTTPASDKFIPLGAGLGTDIPVLETITNTVTAVSRTGCIQIEGTSELVEIIYNPATGSQQIPCSSEEVKVLPTPFPVSGRDSSTPQDKFSQLFGKITTGQASESDIKEFNQLAIEGMRVDTYIDEDGNENKLPTKEGYTAVRQVVEDSKTGERKSEIVYRNNLTGQIAAFFSKGNNDLN